jgi:hypothetical protein
VQHLFPGITPMTVWQVPFWCWIEYVRTAQAHLRALEERSRGRK